MALVRSIQRTLLNWRPALVFVALCAGCGGGSITDPERLVLAVSATPHAVVVGDTLQAVLRVSNPTARPISITGNGCVLLVEIRSIETGALARPAAGSACQDLLQTITLAPGETIERAQRWEVPGDVAPGPYVARGVVDAREGEARSAGVTFRIEGGNWDR